MEQKTTSMCFTTWENFRTLPEWETIKVPRWFLKTDVKIVLLNSFADVSTKAYGTTITIYIQTVSNINEKTSQFLYRKSCMVPMKVITIPSLELSACLLLAKQTHKVLAVLKQPVHFVILWSDSTIDIEWIDTSSSLLKIFVSNSVWNSVAAQGISVATYPIWVQPSQYGFSKTRCKNPFSKWTLVNNTS